MGRNSSGKDRRGQGRRTGAGGIRQGGLVESTPDMDEHAAERAAPAGAPAGKDRERRLVRITLAGAAVNALLAAGKLAAGVLGRSAALVADAAHSAEAEHDALPDAAERRGVDARRRRRGLV